MARVLVVDDERSLREFLEIFLEGEGHEVLCADSLATAMLVLPKANPDLVVTDLKLGDGSGMDLLRWMRHHHPEGQVIMMTAFGTTDNAVEAMRLGAYDYQTKPVKIEELRVVINKALEKAGLVADNMQLTARLQERSGMGCMIGHGGRMSEVYSLIDKVAPGRTNILIEGESGTGKELVARAIHTRSERRGGRFIPVNCGAIPDTLIEAELFGHVAGAFTGATKARLGLFETANHGTLLLDEIGELPNAMQVKLLRVLQERTVRRVGDDHERAIDVRIIAATNRDLEAAVDEGTFRKDLFYRLNVVRIRVPPLRERPGDIPELAKHFIKIYTQDAGRTIEGITDDAINTLVQFHFPGNVRELENYIERAVALCGGRLIQSSDLPEHVRSHFYDGPTLEAAEALPEAGIDLEATLQRIEHHYIEQAMQRAQGVKTKAAKMLGLSFRSFRYRIQKLGTQGHGSIKKEDAKTQDQ